MRKKKENNLDFFGKINLEDFLLCTPYEKREGRDLQNALPEFLTEKLFNEKLYSFPIVNKKDIFIDENELQDDTDYPIISTSANPISIEHFESRLKTDNSIAQPLFVRGYSGTGKTTF